MLVTLLKLCAFCFFVCGVYFIIPKSKRWWVILAGNIAFYFSFGDKLFIFFCISLVSTYAGGRLLDRLTGTYKEQAKLILDREDRKRLKERITRQKRMVVFFCLLINLGIWAFLKCTDLVAVFGISYYSFVAAGYLIDLYRGKYAAEKNIFKLAAFLSFFLQMIQGPFSRYDEVAPFLFAGNQFSWERVYNGGMRIMWGIFKKCLIADKLSVPVSYIYENYQTLNGSLVFIAMVFFGIQLYADFSGYMDIMLGVAKILGIHMPENFKQPFFSKSIEEFWRRWHITLGAWFKNYLFYPVSMSKWAQNLGVKSRKIFGNRTGRLIPSYLALILVWSATGLWHGMSLHFWLWGMMQMVVIIFGMQMAPVYERMRRNIGISKDSKIFRLFQCVRTFFLFCFMEIMSEAATVTDALSMYGKLFTEFDVQTFFNPQYVFLNLSNTDIFVVILGMLLMLVVDILKEKQLSLKDTILRIPIFTRYVLYFGMIYMIVLLSARNSSAGGFMYANF